MNTIQAKQRFGIIGNDSRLERAIDVSLQVAPTDISILPFWRERDRKRKYS